MYNILAYGAMIADKGRTEAYARALEAKITPGAVVVDLGTGPGIMALVACRAGAGRVYAIESEDVIQIAREVAAANGFSDRIRFIQATSANVDLPERVDGIVSDLRGALPFFGSGVSALIDARNRWLKSGAGWLISERDTVWASLVSSPRLHSRFVANWDSPLGFDFASAREKSENRYAEAGLENDELQVPPLCWGLLEYGSVQSPSVAGEVAWTLDRRTTLHGLGAWFDTETAPGLGFSNSPVSDRHVYRQVFFPWPAAIELAAGANVRVSLRADFVGADYIFSWETEITDSVTRQRQHSFRQSTFNGAVVSPQTLRRRAETHVPEPSDWAEIDRRVLELMGLRLSIGEIADRLMIEFPLLVNSRPDTLTRVGVLGERYARPDRRQL